MCCCCLDPQLKKKNIIPSSSHHEHLKDFDKTEFSGAISNNISFYIFATLIEIHDGLVFSSSIEMMRLFFYTIFFRSVMNIYLAANQFSDHIVSKDS